VLADGAVALGAVELDALVVFLLDEQAELRTARARLAAAILAHRCFAFIFCIVTFRSNRVGQSGWVTGYGRLGSQTRIGPLARLAHR